MLQPSPLALPITWVRAKTDDTNMRLRLITRLVLTDLFMLISISVEEPKRKVAMRISGIEMTGVILVSRNWDLETKLVIVADSRTETLEKRLMLNSSVAAW